MKINGKELEKSFIFPAGEVQIKLPKFHINGKENKIVVETVIDSSDKIMELLLVKEALDNYYSCYYTKLILHYLPYARQDRRCADDESFAGKVAIELIDNLCFSEIEIADIHNANLLNHFIRTKVKHISVLDIIAKNSDILQYVNTIIAPDKGALDKVKEIADTYKKDFLFATKKRDVNTGKITDLCFEFDDDVLYQKILNKNILIIDDIVDAGGTFIGLAKIINHYLPKSLSLYVTHGIFSKGLESLFQSKIDRIYTTRSFFNWDRIYNKCPQDMIYKKEQKLNIIDI